MNREVYTIHIYVNRAEFFFLSWFWVLSTKYAHGVYVMSGLQEGGFCAKTNIPKYKFARCLAWAIKIEKKTTQLVHHKHPICIMCRLSLGKFSPIDTHTRTITYYRGASHLVLFYTSSDTIEKFVYAPCAHTHTHTIPNQTHSNIVQHTNSLNSGMAPYIS